MSTTYNIVAPDFFKRYISLVEEEDLQLALRANRNSFLHFLDEIPAGKRDYAYAEGKWTIKQVLQHISDAERVFAYRALWFARKAPDPLPGFDENAWANEATAAERLWEHLTEEFMYVRFSTETLFGSFGREELDSAGISNKNKLSVAALGFMCAGHVEHHMNIITERYL